MKEPAAREAGASAGQPVVAKAAPKKPAGIPTPSGPPRDGAGPRPRTRAAPHASPGLSEEDQIRAAKYLPRELPKRVFEEERFIFPETYGVNRVRLLVRDPEWIFAYWDVSPAAMKDFAQERSASAPSRSRASRCGSSTR